MLINQTYKTYYNNYPSLMKTSGGSYTPTPPSIFLYSGGSYQLDGTEFSVTGSTVTYDLVNNTAKLDTPTGATEILSNGYGLDGNIDVSNCPNLESIDLYENLLVGLNLSGCTSLNYVDCSENNLTSLNITGLSNVLTLYCSYNNLTGAVVDSILINLVAGLLEYGEVDLRENTPPSLSGLAQKEILEDRNWRVYVDPQPLYSGGSYQLDGTEFNVTGSTVTYDLVNNTATLDDVGSVTIIECIEPDIDGVINVQNCTGLKSLDCSGTALTTLNVTGLTSLTALDITGCLDLTSCNCSSNALVTLVNVAGLVKLVYLDASFNNFNATSNTYIDTILQGLVANGTNNGQAYLDGFGSGRSNGIPSNPTGLSYVSTLLSDLNWSVVKVNPQPM